MLKQELRSFYSFKKLNHRLKLNVSLLHFVVPFIIIIFTVFKQVVQRRTTCLEETIFYFQMNLLLIDVENIAKGMKNANSGLGI
jgi:hypothetical protein